MRELVKLVCTECGDENYHTTKNKKDNTRSFGNE